MAEGLLRALYGERFEVHSAGLIPTSVNPYAVKVMAEIGIDISMQRSKSLEEFRGEKFDYVITVCDQASKSCPFFLGGEKQIHRGFEDPAAYKGTEEETLAIFRRVRDEIKNWIEQTFRGSG
jgi:arsenate reductase